MVGGAASKGIEDEAISASASSAEVKFREIIDLLVAAGYFRARISGLSPFDKVIGGLTWCISSADVDVDVDVLFIEDSSIGTRIKLGEAIVKALRLMRCAYPLQSHQIRGLDYDAIFPVIQWLVKKVMETREERGELIRSFSESQFTKHRYRLPTDEQREKARPEGHAFLRSVLDRYRPVRKYRRAQKSASAAAETPEEARTQRVRETLLEYGGRVKVLASDSSSASQQQQQQQQGKGADGVGHLEAIKGGAAGLRGSGASEPLTAEGRREAKDREKEVRHAEEEARAMEELLAQMDSLGERAKKSVVSASGVGQVIGKNAAAIRAMNEERAALQEQLEKIIASGEGGGAMRREAHRRQVAALRKQIATLEEMQSKTHEELGEAVEARDGAKQRAAKATAYNERVVRETEKLTFEKTDENMAAVAMLTSLVMANEKLKEQEAAFRASCKKQLSEWRALMEKLESSGAGDGASGDTEEEKRMAEIEKTHETDVAKHGKIKQILAAKNRELALLLRKIDDIPTRTELIQYERRFVELYREVARKTEETRKYYNTYNSLCDTKTYLTKETTILNSICENIQTVNTKKKGGADKLLQSIDDIINSVRTNLEKIESRFASEKQSNAKLHEKHSELMEKQRAYFKAVSLFKEACFTNERLLAELGE